MDGKGPQELKRFLQKPNAPGYGRIGLRAGRTTACRRTLGRRSQLNAEAFIHLHPQRLWVQHRQSQELKCQRTIREDLLHVGGLSSKQLISSTTNFRYFKFSVLFQNTRVNFRAGSRKKTPQGCIPTSVALQLQHVPTRKGTRRREAEQRFSTALSFRRLMGKNGFVDCSLGNDTNIHSPFPAPLVANPSPCRNTQLSPEHIFAFPNHPAPSEQS